MSQSDACKAAPTLVLRVFTHLLLDLFFELIDKGFGGSCEFSFQLFDFAALLLVRQHKCCAHVFHQLFAVGRESSEESREEKKRPPHIPHPYF
jgi:hypothetical protein